MPTDEKIYETWNEIGVRLNCSAIHAKRLFYGLVEQGSKFPKQLRYYLGKGHRIKMTQEEVETFKQILWEQAA